MPPASTETAITEGNIEYVPILPFNGKREAFAESIDEGINYAQKIVEEYEKDNDDEYNPHIIKLSGDEFLIPVSSISNPTYYDGTFSINNGVIQFFYKNWINKRSGDKVNINDKFEVDRTIIDGTSQKLEGLSEIERDELIYNERIKSRNQSFVEMMQKLNKTGSYIGWVVTPICTIDKYQDFSVLPFIRVITTGGSVNTDYPNTLIFVDDFLCTYTYGIEIVGKYNSGEDFILKYDFEDAVENDEQTRLLNYKGKDGAEEYFNRLIKISKLQYKCDNVETTIKFSDGEWEWFNDDGGLINNGRYDESKEYPGLIMMYVDEKSKKSSKYALDTYPMWFYIADDGEIYYPGYVKAD